VDVCIFKLKHVDDMLSLRNFYVNIITFRSSQGNLNSKKTEEKGKDKIVARLVKNVTWLDKAECIVSTLRKTCHDGKNVTRFGETLIQFLVTQGENVSRFTKNVTRFWANFCVYLSWRLFKKQGLRFQNSKVRFWDLKTARRAISSTFFQFMYVLIPLLIMLFVNLIMSS